MRIRESSSIVVVAAVAAAAVVAVLVVVEVEVAICQDVYLHVSSSPFLTTLLDCLVITSSPTHPSKYLYGYA